MKYISTGSTAHATSLEDAVVSGLAPDGGIYLPESLTPLPDAFFRQLPTLSFVEIAREVMEHLLGEDLPLEIIRGIVERSFTFDAPLVPISDSISALELFHGPTAAFKDFGARFMAQLLGHYAQKRSRTATTVLVATSGDTGGAVASGFHRTEGVSVVILFPAGKVSPLQELQLTTFGDNIRAVAVEGTFDDCQRLVKQAFLDRALSTRFGLTSANSINIARLLPQSLYYFRAVGSGDGRPPVFAVPSGNFGNLTGGLIAERLGLPIASFIAATNRNDTVPRFLESDRYEARPSVQTISNAMDVGAPNNFARMASILGPRAEDFKRRIFGFSCSDDETRAAIEELHTKYGYVADPHGAVAYRALSTLSSRLPDAPRVFLETAHPAKFAEVVEPAIGMPVALPSTLAALDPTRASKEQIENSFPALTEVLGKLLI